MNSQRQQVLRAVTQAAELCERYPVGSRTGFDVTGAVEDLGVPLLYRPLDRLLGATIAVETGGQGVLVTTQRDHHVQRFTLAHELGHVLLGHSTTFDLTVGVENSSVHAPTSPSERAADAFASELLMPRSLIASLARRHAWKGALLRDPTVAYQLSLRLGISFAATCWGLAGQRLVSTSAAQELQATQPKVIKRGLAPDPLISDPWADVWELTEQDSGCLLEASQHDVFAVRLYDNSSAGFLWELDDLGPDCDVVKDTTEDLGERLGVPAARTVFLKYREPGFHRLHFAHRRPWSGQVAAHIDLTLDNHGKETVGLPRKTKLRALGVAA